MEYEEYYLFEDFNITDFIFYDYDYVEFLTPELRPAQIAALVLYGLVVLLGVPGNALVIVVTGFWMPRSVTSIWFLNLALADLLCCLSVIILMVLLTQDDHWHFGPSACPLVKGLLHLVMFCSILQLALISLDRWLLVSKPVWCRNNRRPKRAAFVCVAVWCLALIGSFHQFVYTREIQTGKEKRECVTIHSKHSMWLVTSYRFVVGFILPFLVIVVCHLVVYRKADSRFSSAQTRSKRTLRVILAVVLSFFLCWFPLNVLDFIHLIVSPLSVHIPNIYTAHLLAKCLAYFNSCLNPLLYVCLGQGFKDSMNHSLRNILNFLIEDPTNKVSSGNEAKSTRNDTEMNKV